MTTPPAHRGPTLYTPDDDWEPWIGYIRVSTWKEEKISPELQRAAIESWATHTRRRIIAWVTDLDATGRNFKRRVMGAIERVERREARGIAVWKYSRFGRNDLGIKLNVTRLEHAGGQLASATEEIDVSTAVGKFSRNMMFNLAVFESDRAGEMWKDAHAYRRAAGLPATGGRRLGYIWHPRRIPDPHRPGEWILQREWYEPEPGGGAERIATLLPRHMAGEGYASLAAWVSGLGYRTRRGELYRADSLRRYMDSGFAAGLLRVHDPECGCDYTAAGGRCSRWIHIDGAHDALNSPEEWEQYTEYRQRRRALAPRVRSPSYTLTGLVRCGVCRGGATVTSARRRGQQVLGYAYMCDARAHAGTTVCPVGVWIQRAVVEDEVQTWVLAQSEAETARQSPRPAVGHDARAQARADRDRLQAEHDRLAAALTTLRVQRAADPEDWGPGEYEAARDRIRREQAAVQEALTTAAEAAIVPKRDDYRGILGDLATAWGALSVQERNGLLHKLIRRVVCTREAHRSRTTRIEIHPLWEPDPWETAE
ncbi:recombinase family protein [Streptomyces sp. NPDC020983]|uniref:recombinase family protein n=1 Tax=Streptomyces sp. NPDC020983 TaxID=3365106 RepID=UPI003793FA55